jgi:predicted DNA-binding transcriptional regulator AlpA
MTTYVFRLAVSDPIDDQGANRLFEAGVDDGSPETGPRGHSIGFDREATSLREAVLSAIREVEEAGFKVLRVEPDELVSASDIAERTGRSRQSISALINGTRGPGAWPRPVAGNVRSPLWRWSDVQAWFQKFDRSQQVNEEEAALLAAINDLLAARNALEHVKKRDRATIVRQLVALALPF